MKFILALGFVNGLLFTTGILWLVNTGFPPVLPVFLLVVSSFTSGLLLGGDE